MMLRTWPVFRRRPFVLVMSGEWVSMIGDSFYTGLIPTESSPQVLALTLIFLGVPRGLLSLFGGVWTDRFSVRLVMFWLSSPAGVLVVGGLTLVAALGEVRPWHFFLVAASFGVADAFFWPASKTIIPALVPRSEIVQANAVNSIGEQATTLIGPALGGLVVSLGGPIPALGINAVTFLGVSVRNVSSAANGDAAPVTGT